MNTLQDLRQALLARGYNSCIGQLPRRRTPAYGTTQGPTADTGVPSHYVAILLRPSAMPLTGLVEGLVTLECYDDSQSGAFTIAAAVSELVADYFGRVLRMYQQDKSSQRGIVWPCWIVECNLAYAV